MLSSVDSLASTGGGIVIQVLGELSNRDEPSQKFAETFFLAEQPTGYFVLNDIFRYLKEDVESDYDETDPEPLNDLGSSSHDVSLSRNGIVNGFHSDTDAPASEQIDNREEPLTELSVDPRQTDETQADTGTTIPENSESGLHDEVSRGATAPGAMEQLVQSSTEAMEHEPEPTLHEEPSPTRAREPSVEAKSHAPAPASTPTVPLARSWATMAATNSEKWHAPQELRASAVGSLSHPKPVTSQPSRKEAVKVSSVGIPTLFALNLLEKPEPALGYIKHVGPKVQKTALHDALVKFGPLKDLDINRQKVLVLLDSSNSSKSCGFVEFANMASLHDAIAASPIDLDSTIKLVVEERRKSAKTGEAKTAKQVAGDRRQGAKPEDGRGPRRAPRGTGASGAKQRGE